MGAPVDAAEVGGVEGGVGVLGICAARVARADWGRCGVADDTRAVDIMISFILMSLRIPIIIH